MQETNGRLDWIRWVNTVLLLAVSALLSLFIQSNDRRISKLEDTVARQERVVHLEEEVTRISSEQVRRGTQLDFLDSEVIRLRKFHEH